MPPNPPSPPWRLRFVMALAAWPVAFGLVLAILTVFKDQLASLSLGLRALVLSGVLVGVMASVVMPYLSAAISRWPRR